MDSPSETENRLISEEECINNKGEHWIVLVKGTCSLELFCFLDIFFSSVENQLAFSSILKMLAYKLCFLRQWYLPPGRQSQLSAFILKYLQNGFEGREGKKQSLAAYLRCLFNVTSPSRCSPNQLIAKGMKLFPLKHRPRPFMYIKAQSVICVTAAFSFPVFVFRERRLWPNNNMLED